MAGVEDGRLAATLAAVGDTVRALGAPFYVVGILPPRGTPPEVAARLHTHHKTYSAEQLAGAPVVKYLRAMNAQGHDIYVKPAGLDDGTRPPVVMVDDLTAAAVARMKADGREPALEVTSSPGNHQVWVRVGDRPLPVPVLREVARDLAATYGGDPMAAKGEQFGRLPGFTNRKPQRIQENGGRAPFARVVEAVGRVASQAASLVRTCAQRVQQQAAEGARRWERAQAEAARRAAEREGEEVSASVARHMQASGGRQSATHGLSEIDYAAACGALRDGHSPEAVADALRALSPHLEQRHVRPDDYVTRTVENAAAAVGRHFR